MSKLISELKTIGLAIKSYDFEHSNFTDSWTTLCLAQDQYVGKIEEIFEAVQEKENREEIRQLTEQLRGFLREKKTLPTSWLTALINTTIQFVEDESMQD